MGQSDAGGFSPGAAVFMTVYFAIGIYVAVQHGYNSLQTFQQALSFFGAMVLWPAVLLGYDMNLNIQLPTGPLAPSSG